MGKNQLKPVPVLVRSTTYEQVTEASKENKHRQKSTNQTYKSNTT